MGKTVIPYSGYASQGLQVFTPIRVETVAPAGSITMAQSATQDEIFCVRVHVETDYKINGVGDTATMPVGCTGIANGVTSMSFPNGAIVEVM